MSQPLPARPARTSARTPGFTLVLSLSLMGLLVLLLLGLAGLLSLGGRSATGSLSAAKARLNARMAGRLALAHLQQEAGPDQRSTATGELAGSPCERPMTAAEGATEGEPIGQGQPRWTGVWRTDRPDQPPAWLTSGKATATDAARALPQAASLAALDDYPVDYWAPWQSDHLDGVGRPLATLVGAGSSAADGRIALPWIGFGGAGATVAEGFAYWIGDEGVKARTDLEDPRDLAHPAPAAAGTLAALRCPGRLGVSLLGPTTPGAKAPPEAFHDLTTVAAGVMADSLRGGLRRDLSLAFEMTDRDFDRSEFGDGLGEPDGLGAPTELHTSGLHPVTGEPTARKSWFPPFPGRAPGETASPDPRPRVWVPMWEGNPDNPGRDAPSARGACHAWAPVFMREDEMGRPPRDPRLAPELNLEPPYSSPRRLVGPLWHLLRDHYLLYREVRLERGAPTMDARSFFPDTDALTRGGYRPDPTASPFHPYDLDRAYWSNGGLRPDRADRDGDTPDPMGVPNGTKRGRAQPRATREAVAPLIHRLALVLSLRPVEDGGGLVRLRLLMTPVLALHNPHDIRLRLRAGPEAEEPDPRAAGCAARLGLTGLADLKVMLRTHEDNDPRRPALSVRGARVDRILGIRAATELVDDENLGLLIPDMTLEPGELVILGARTESDLGRSDPSTPRVVRLSRGLFADGGLGGDLATHALTLAGNPNHATSPQMSRFARGGEVACWIDAEDLHWRHTLHLRSWRGQLGDDGLFRDSGWPAPLGTSPRDSRASRAAMINLGSLDASSPRFMGDPGSASHPVGVGPLDPEAPRGGRPGWVVGVIDTRIRVSDSTRRTSPDRALMSWRLAWDNPVPAPHPVWAMSNPLAQTSNSPGFVYAGMPGSPKPSMSSSVGNPCHRTELMGGDELGMAGPDGRWDRLLGVVPREGGAAARIFGGNSHGTSGALSHVAVEIPTLPPLSLGQFMHANVGIWPWLPFHAVGGSLATPAVPKDKCWIHGVDPGRGSQPGGHTLPDISYLMNQALWDGFFLSGAATEVDLARDGGLGERRVRDAQSTLGRFAEGVGTLGNPRLRLHQPAGLGPAAADIGEAGFVRGTADHAPWGHRRLAAYLLADGAFNVNSLSTEAWTALLGSTEGLGIGEERGDRPGYRFARAVGGARTAARPELASAGYWKGFVRLDEGQLRALARGVVEEVRARARFHRRTERDQEYPPSPRRFRGFPAEAEPGTPFLGIGEFVNRFLGPTRRAGAHARSSLYAIRCDGEERAEPVLDASADRHFWMLASGTLESALGRADLLLGARAIAGRPAGGSTLVAATSHDWGADGARSGMPPGYFFRNVELPAAGMTEAYAAGSPTENRAHDGMGAPGCLTQADLLQSLGPLLATRSDTFRIRAAGRSEGASATLELVAQRLPDYVDPRDAPWTRPDLPGMSPANRLLGRRFRVIQARWLRPDET